MTCNHVPTTPTCARSDTNICYCRALQIVLMLLTLLFATGAHAQRDAAFVSQSVPTTMVTGSVYNVTVTMKNTGSTTWTSA